MRRRQPGMSRFARGLILYILIFIFLAVVVLGVLYSYLHAYEESRSGTTVKNYLSACTDGELTYSWGASLAGLDRRFQTEADARSWICEKLANAMYRELRSEDTEEKLYGIFDENGLCLAKLTLRQNGEERWGFTGWTVTGEDCSLDGFGETFEFLLPEGYTAELGGRVLDDGFVVASQIDYEILEPFKDYRVKLPTLKRYRVGPILPGQELRIQDEQGREVPQEQNEADYLPKCSEADRKRLEEFALDFLNAYLPYAGDLNRAGYAYWDTLYYMIVHGGTLEDRLIQARSGFGYGNTYSVEILSDDVRLAADLGNDYYLIDIGYRTETVGLHGPVQEDNQARLLIVEQEGDAYYGQERQLYVEAMFNY